MIQSIIVYSLLMGIMMIFSIYATRNSSLQEESLGIQERESFWKFEIIFPLFLFAVIFGMRYDVGGDHISYLDGYLQKEYIGRNDFLFNLFSEIGWKINLHYAFYFGTFAFIQVFLFYYSFKNEKYLFPFLTFFLFTNTEWEFWMNGIRQAIALCIWIYSIKYLELNKFWKYVLCVLLATLFHKSAIILIIFYPIFLRNTDYFKSVKIQIILFTAAFVFKTLFSELIFRFEPIVNYYSNLLGDNAYNYYNMDWLMGNIIERKGTGLAYIFIILLNLFLILYSKKLKLFYNSKRFNIMYFFFFIGIITTYMFPTGAVSFTRPFRYFYIFQSIMYAYFLYYLFRTKIHSNVLGYRHALIYFGLIIIFLGIFLLSQITSNENAHLWYQFFFDQDIYGYPN